MIVLVRSHLAVPYIVYLFLKVFSISWFSLDVLPSPFATNSRLWTKNYSFYIILLLIFAGFLWWVYGGICGAKVCCKVSPCFCCKRHLHCDQFHSGNDTTAYTWFSFNQIEISNSLYLIKLNGHCESRPSSFRRVGCRICIGKEMDVLHAQATLILFASTNKIVPLKHQAVKAEGVQ